ncbi:MAG: class I SAM-dependent methyltransferase [Candidatus Omnitrophica bacterium]|nr:class I SAM-dependent methyltransferase [Candidatus Omnitrophota bacterium]
MEKEKILEDFKNYYDQRYSTGYNPQWPIEQKQRIFELIKTLDLPKKGSVLDFGCGRGEFTRVIKQALPEWDVWGIDISAIAIESAQKSCPECLFSVLSDISAVNQKFDLVFSNHVLEHIDNLDQTWSEMNQLFKQKAWFLLVLPCGNKGSFEYKLSMLHKNGIKKDKGNVFFHEDETHLRRLTSEQINVIVLRNGFKPVLNYFANHFYGAIYWLTIGKPAVIFSYFDPRDAKDQISAIKLISLYFMFMLIKILKFPANTIDHKKATKKGSKYWICFGLFFLLYPISKLITIYLDHKVKQEWAKKKTEPTGSEMYLFYSRG